MSDLISREAALDELYKELDYEAEHHKPMTAIDAFRIAIRRIKKLPAVDADAYFDAIDRIKPCPKCRYQIFGSEPVKHGYWKDRGNKLECSECGREYTKYDWEGSVVPYYWCPDCGAKMHVEVY